MLFVLALLGIAFWRAHRNVTESVKEVLSQTPQKIVEDHATHPLGDRPCCLRCAAMGKGHSFDSEGGD
jgi:hypothetical protein